MYGCAPGYMNKGENVCIGMGTSEERWSGSVGSWFRFLPRSFVICFFRFVVFCCFFVLLFFLVFSFLLFVLHLVME